MELELSMNKKEVSITIDNPFRPDLAVIVNRIDQFLLSQGAKLNGLDVRGLLPHMIKGIAGCEAGCPADAQRVVSRGYENFSLQYIEGGILTATAKLAEGGLLSLKLFPDF